MPHALEFPRMLRPVVPLMRRKRFARFRGGVVDKLVAFAFRHTIRGRRGFPRWCARLEPCLPAVIGSLNDLPKPCAGLRSVNSIAVRGRSLKVVHLAAGKVW